MSTINTDEIKTPNDTMQWDCSHYRYIGLLRGECLDEFKPGIGKVLLLTETMVGTAILTTVGTVAPRFVHTEHAPIVSLIGIAIFAIEKFYQYIPPMVGDTLGIDITSGIETKISIATGGMTGVATYYLTGDKEVALLTAESVAVVTTVFQDWMVG